MSLLLAVRHLLQLVEGGFTGVVFVGLYFIFIKNQLVGGGLRIVYSLMSLSSACTSCSSTGGRWASVNALTGVVFIALYVIIIQTQVLEGWTSFECTYCVVVISLNFIFINWWKVGSNNCTHTAENIERAQRCLSWCLRKWSSAILRSPHLAEAVSLAAELAVRTCFTLTADDTIKKN